MHSTPVASSYRWKAQIWSKFIITENSALEKDGHHCPFCPLKVVLIHLF